MQPKSLIQLKPQQFDIHFPLSDRKLQLGELKSATQLLSDAPIPDLRKLSSTELLNDVEVLVTGWGSHVIDHDLRQKMPNLKLIAHLAGTVKNHVPQAIAASGVQLVSAASANARPVAEFTLAHILLHVKGIDDWRRLYRQDRSKVSTRTSPLHNLVGNRGRTIGVVGASRIGRLVIEYVQRHGISVLVHDPFIDEQVIARLGATKVTMDELLQQSDVVSLHQPLLPSTERSFGRAEFEKMRDGALLINTARGKIVDTAALEQAMADGRLCSVIDVTEPEPLNDDSPLWEMNNVKLSPHAAGALGREVSDLTDLVISEIARFSRGELLQHEISVHDWDKVA